MYNKLFKKYYLYKICSIYVPKYKTVIKSSFYLGKYISSNSFYTNINEFSKELSKFISIFFYLTSTNNKLAFVCTNKIFYKSLQSFKNCDNWQIVHEKNIIHIKKLCFLIMYTNVYKFSLISDFKNKKIISVGLLNYQNLTNLTDYTLLLNNKYFANVYILHFLLKKIFKNAMY